jgi:RNA polymerase sigma factor (sigma-70 family)
MPENPPTNHQDIEDAGHSTILDFERIRINAALSNIYNRFKGPLTKSFAQRLAHNQERAEEKFADFMSYLIENRKPIFRRFDPEKGRLQNYIYQIAHRFLSKNLQTNKVSIEDILERQSKEFGPDQLYEAECANSLINLAMKELQQKHPEWHRLLHLKYLSGTEETLKSRDLAIQLGKLKPEASAEEVKRAQNAIDQLIRKAKKEVVELLKFHLHNEVDNQEIDLEEELRTLIPYISWISIE